MPVDFGLLLDLLRRDDLDQVMCLVIENQWVNLQFPRYTPLLKEFPALIHRPRLISVAAYFGALDCFRFLCLNHSDLYAMGECRQGPVGFAIGGGHPEVIDVMVELGLLSPSLSNLCLVKCAEYGRLDLFREFWCRFDDPEIEFADERGFRVVHYCARNGDVEFLRHALELRADPNSRVAPILATPLHFAAIHPTSEALSFLLHVQGIDVDARTVAGETPLLWAARTGALENVKVWCETAQHPHLDAVDQTQSSVLHAAVINHRSDVVEYLMGLAGLTLNLRSGTGQSPLDFAAVLGFLDLRERLLAVGQRAYNGGHLGSLLVVALENQDMPFLRRLVEELHADINLIGPDGVTALGCAVMLKYYEAVDYLLAIPGRTLGKLPAFGAWEPAGRLSMEMWTYLEQKAPELLADDKKPRIFPRRPSND
jgi:ankyrin repeat protein